MAEPIGSSVPVRGGWKSSRYLGVAVYVHVWVGLPLCIGWLSPLFEFMKQWFPRFAEIEAPISVNVIWMPLYFDGISVETIHVADFYGEEFGFL